MSSFIQYNDVILDGFVSNSKRNDIINKKRDLLDSILGHYQIQATNILFVGFSPWCLGLSDQPFAITEVSDKVLEFLDKQGCNYTHYDLTALSNKKYSIVIASDEYFTFASTDIEQRSLVDTLSKLTSGIIVTTLRDYKNQDFKDREFSQPIMVKGQDTGKIFLEHYEYDIKDKNSSVSKTFVINEQSSEMFGPFARRNMYFKQLAKFSMDAGASSFFVHKIIMYKSIIKKNYEHIITIKF
jgi:hypothetical protein